jgi:hypothetical protein
MGNETDQFSIDLCFADRLDEHQKVGDGILFFVWNHALDPQYIPLRPVYERLEGNPQRDRLMATLYHWLYGTASRIFEPFGLAEAESMYQWRRDIYLSEREDGEDVDLEGEVEYADPAKVMEYIRRSNDWRLKPSEIDGAIKSVSDLQLRNAFERAHAMYAQSRSIRLPEMSAGCRHLVEQAAYYMDASSSPAVGISHWRDDPIVAWFDEMCREQFESGTDPRAPIILAFHRDDRRYFMRIISALPKMVRTAAGLNWWVRFAEELENASHYADRDGDRLPAETGDSDL